jgi:hypothetical protein
MQIWYGKIFSFIITSAVFFFALSPTANAIYDPLSRPNNMFGMHILFNSELPETADFVNSNGGQWGYVTIPIQMGDYDLVKWQSFMNTAREKKVIPIVRLMTDPYWANTNVWRKPSNLDIVDMANFLNSLNWPIENRYIIVFNEMNRSDEWGGNTPNPEEYAEMLANTVDIFKERNADFYMIMGGLDNAAPNDGVNYIDNFTYLERMYAHLPDVFKKIDGFSSHSYPNPGFEQPPSDTARMGTATYKYEYEFIAQAAGSKKPVFITETGWDNTKVAEETIASYYKKTFDEIWGKDTDKIVAVTPFLLKSHGGFDQFAFIKQEKKTAYYTVLANVPKTSGDPILKAPPADKRTIASAVRGIATQSDIADPLELDMSYTLKEYFKTLLGL